MTHIYNNTFFDYIDHGARSSAREFIALLKPWLAPDSVLDLGCGRGVWLDEWRASGVADVMGVDGDYVDRANLAIPAEQFMGTDLTQPVKTDRHFALAQSLEVGEHLPTKASEALVQSLTDAADVVVFSAATVGQGGEFHVNEQPLHFWQDLFAKRGYQAFDCLRPEMKGNTEVEPWYRYNAIVYVRDTAVADLPDHIRATGIPAGEKVRDGGDLMWKLRRNIVGHLPQGTVTKIAQARAKIIAARANARKSQSEAAA